MMSAREKIRRLMDRCNPCLAKERSIQAKRGPHVPTTVGNVGEKVFIDLVGDCEKESLLINSPGWVYKVCQCISYLQ